MTKRHPPFGPGEAGDDSAGFGPAAHWRGLFGRHRGGPFARGRGPRMFDSGALRLLVLGLIAEAPRHGYDIIRDLHDRFQGAYQPSPGSIYPILQTLAEAGLVTSEMHGRQRLFAVSEEGRAYLAEQSVELAAINAQLAEASGSIGESAIGKAIQDLRAALYEKLRRSALTATQAAKLRDALERARREIEEI
jgi:DNA-binding PadR family transcriptional regulator